MKMKLITSLLVLCLAMSLVPVQAQADATGMDKNIATDKMSKNLDGMTVIIAGKVNGAITYNKDEMNGMANEGEMNGMANEGEMNGMANQSEMNGMANQSEMNGMAGSTGEKNNMTRNINGDLIIVKNIRDKTENIVIVGKMDGMTKKVVIHGKIDYKDRMANENKDMSRIAGKMDNKETTGEMDNRNVVVTGDINCDMVGKMSILGTMSDMKEMAGENDNMTAVGAGAEEAEYENGNMQEVAAYKADSVMSKDEDMKGSMEDKENMTGAMDKNVIKSATIRLNMTGKMIILGRLSDIEEAMAGYEKEDMKGTAGYKVGEVGYKDGDKAGTAGYEKEDMKEVNAGKVVKAGVKGENLTLVMTGIVKCKMTGINMAVIGDIDQMDGYKTNGMERYKNTMMTGNESVMVNGNQAGKTCDQNGQYQGQNCGEQAQSKDQQCQSGKSQDQSGSQKNC